ncbi:MAG TPA: hypothetical protein VKQ36_01320, partial [Ktedonobacterales bacterium]|nr:hypothetical protein [Ktedonobacterales bacterium]
ATREPATANQIARVLAVLEHTGARLRAQEALREQVERANEALAAVVESANEPLVARESEAYTALDSMLAFVAEDGE